MQHHNDSTQERVMGLLTKEVHNIFDSLHETLSGIKVRISKLEQYARLQDDINKKLESGNKEEAEEKLYSFVEAMMLLKEGKQIKRKGWHSIYWLSKDRFIDMNKRDMFANDWQVRDC